MQTNQVPAQGKGGDSSVRQTQQVQPAARTPEQAQQTAQPALTEHVPRQQAAQDLMELDPPPNVGLQGGTLVPLAPLVQRYAPPIPGGLSRELWQFIFRQLDDKARSRIMLTCRALYDIGQALQAPRPKPMSMLAQTPIALPTPGTAIEQHKICHAKLVPILNEYKELCSRLSAQVEAQPWAQSYAAALEGLASTLSFIELPIWSGFEDAVVNALLAGPVWKAASLHISEQANPALVSRLEQGLAQQNRHCTVDLHLEDPSDWTNVLPTGAALELSGLYLKEIDYEKLEALQPLLGSDNQLLRLSVSGNDTPDPILPWLLQGSHKLVELQMDDGPEEGKLLVDVLKKKNQLSRFTLANTTFAPGDLILSDVLVATPNLEVLQLRAVHFQPGGAGQCTAALFNSRLRELHIDCCHVFYTEVAGTAPLKAMTPFHSELLKGLHAAPRLSKLVVDLRNPDHRPSSVQFFIFGFFSNRAAEKLELIDGDPASKLATFIEQLNQERLRRGMMKIEVQWRAADVEPLPDQGVRYASRIVAGQRVAQPGMRAQERNS